MSSVKDKNVLSATGDGGAPKAEAIDYHGDVSVRIALVLDHIGLTRAARAAGKSEKQMRRYASGAEPPFGVLDALVREAGVSFDWLGRGATSTIADHELSLMQNQAQLKEIERDLRTNLSETDRKELYELADVTHQLISLDQLYLERHAATLRDAKPPRSRRERPVGGGSTPAMTADDGENTMLRLPIYGDVLAAAGRSAIPASEMSDGVMSFDPRFLRDQGAMPEKCVVIWAHGDSMTPTIPDGSALVVDRSQVDVKNGSIMVIGVGDDLLVKRVRRRLDGLIDLISDNSAYAPETLGPDSLQQLRVIGRVVYFCRTP